jgi:hypothetical protein
LAIRERNGVRVGLQVKDLDGRSLGRVTRLFESGFDFEKGLPLLFRQDFTATYDEVRGVKDGVLLLARSKDALLELARGVLPTTWRAPATKDGFPTAATPREASQLAKHAGKK